MKHIQTGLAMIFIFLCAPALAENTDGANDPFQEVAATYRAANPKPQLPEEARKFKVQAEFAVREKQFDKAVELYGKALEIAPWWPEGHFNRAQILGETKKYRGAMREMKRYLLLVPEAANARAAQDRIYQWEGVAGAEPTRDCPDCPEMLAIPAGGTIGKPFAIGKYEVTQGEWKAVMGNNPSKFTNCGDTCPVEQVSWNDAQEFIQKLNTKTGKQYRLPTEAEWEYACYGGSQSEYCGGNDVGSVAWDESSSGGHTHPVGQKQANGYGLYDMSGNVWEWMENKYDNEHDWRVLRGGSWNYLPQFERAANRFRNGPASRDFSDGFRLARMLP